MIGLLRHLSIAAALSACLSVPALAEGKPAGLLTHVAYLAEDTVNLTARLRGELATDVVWTDADDVPVLAYSGIDTPARLADFLTARFPGLDPALLAPDRAVALSLALVPKVGGTELRLMLSDPNQTGQTGIAVALGPDLPAGTDVLLNDGAAGLCRGQFVLSHDAPQDDTVRTFTALSTARGYSLTDASDATMSFFIGNRPECSFFMYIQPDPETPSRSVIAVRYLED